MKTIKSLNGSKNRWQSIALNESAALQQPFGAAKNMSKCSSNGYFISYYFKIGDARLRYVHKDYGSDTRNIPE